VTLSDFSKKCAYGTPELGTGLATGGYPRGDLAPRSPASSFIPLALPHAATTLASKGLGAANRLIVACDTLKLRAVVRGFHRLRAYRQILPLWEKLVAQGNPPTTPEPSSGPTSALELRATPPQGQFASSTLPAILSPLQIELEIDNYPAPWSCCGPNDGKFSFFACVTRFTFVVLHWLYSGR
jgi:hypothetical protein